MRNPIRKGYIFFGSIPVIFCLYVGIHTGGSSLMKALAITTGGLLGTIYAARKYRRQNKPLTTWNVGINAAIGSVVAATLTGMIAGGPLAAAEAFGYALVTGSLTAWGFGLIATEAFGNRVIIGADPVSLPTS